MAGVTGAASSACRVLISTPRAEPVTADARGVMPRVRSPACHMDRTAHRTGGRKGGDGRCWLISLGALPGAPARVTRYPVRRHGRQEAALRVALSLLALVPPRRSGRVVPTAMSRFRDGPDRAFAVGVKPKREVSGTLSCQQRLQPVTAGQQQVPRTCVNHGVFGELCRVCCR